MEGSPAHRDRHVETAGAYRDHADAAACRRMRVGTEQGLARHAEALEMHLMADAVAGAREPQSVPRRDALEIAVVVHVLEVFLERVVVDIGNGEFGFDPVEPDRFELEIGHGAGSVLRQRLIDSDRDIFPAGGKRPSRLDKMLLQYFFGKCQCHFSLSCIVVKVFQAILYMDTFEIVHIPARHGILITMAKKYIAILAAAFFASFVNPFFSFPETIRSRARNSFFLPRLDRQSFTRRSG